MIGLSRTWWLSTGHEENVQERKCKNAMCISQKYLFKKKSRNHIFKSYRSRRTSLSHAPWCSWRSGSIRIDFVEKRDFLAQKTCFFQDPFFRSNVSPSHGDIRIQHPWKRRTHYVSSVKRFDSWGSSLVSQSKCPLGLLENKNLPFYSDNHLRVF